MADKSPNRKSSDLSLSEFFSAKDLAAGSQTVDISQAKVVGVPKSAPFSISSGTLLTVGDVVYEIGSELGRGCNGGVVLAQEMISLGDSLEAVLKFAFPGCETDLKREVAYMTRLSHPGVVRLLGSGQCDAQIVSDGKMEQKVLDVLIAERLLSNPYVFFDSKPLPPGLAIDVFVNLLRTLEDIHRSKFIHGDIKPDNILLRPNRQVRRATQVIPRLSKEDTRSYLDRSYVHMVAHEEYQPVFGDLGCAIDMSDKHPDKYPATPAYLCPEAFLEHKMGPKRDVYALSVSFAEMLTGAKPYLHEESLSSIGHSMLEERPPFDVERNLARAFDRFSSQLDGASYSAVNQVYSDLLIVINKGMHRDMAKRASSFELIEECSERFKLKDARYVDGNGDERIRWTQTVLPPMKPNDPYFKRK